MSVYFLPMLASQSQTKARAGHRADRRRVRDAQQARRGGSCSVSVPGAERAAHSGPRTETTQLLRSGARQEKRRKSQRHDAHLILHVLPADTSGALQHIRYDMVIPNVIFTDIRGCLRRKGEAHTRTPTNTAVKDYDPLQRWDLGTSKV